MSKSLIFLLLVLTGCAAARPGAAGTERHTLTHARLRLAPGCGTQFYALAAHLHLRSCNRTAPDTFDLVSTTAAKPLQQQLLQSDLPILQLDLK